MNTPENFPRELRFGDVFVHGSNQTPELVANIRSGFHYTSVPIMKADDGLEYLQFVGGTNLVTDPRRLVGHWEIERIELGLRNLYVVIYGEIPQTLEFSLQEQITNYRQEAKLHPFRLITDDDIQEALEYERSHKP